MILGGAQERGMRAGTEPVYAVAGMAKALELAYANLNQERVYVTELKTHFIEGLNNIPGIRFNGPCRDLAKSTYTLVNIGLPINAEKAVMLLFQLDLKGIACSQGSACQSGSSGGSHVLMALASVDNPPMPSLRFSFSIYNTKDEIDYTLKALQEYILASA